MGFLEKIKKGLNRTVQVLQTDVRDLFKTEGRLVDADFVNDLFETLVKTDMGVEAAQSAADEIKEKTGKSPAGLYLDGYDFGGEADVWIDVVRDKSHMAYDAIVCEIASEQREDSDADDS